jgi:hypothetical protein
MEKGDYKMVTDVEEEVQEVVEEEDEEEEEEEDMDQEWKKVGEELERLSHLHSTILARMEKLSIRTSMIENDFQRDIQDCHEASLTDLEKTGEMSFGQRLLHLLDCTPYKKLKTENKE